MEHHTRAAPTAQRLCTRGPRVRHALIIAASLSLTTHAAGQSVVALPAVPVANVLRDLVETAAGASLPEALRDLYRRRDYRPVWFVEGRPNSRAKEIRGRLGTVDAEGLNAANYPVPALLVSKPEDAGPRELALADLATSKTVLRYATDLHDGRFEPRRVDPNWDIARKDRLPASSWLASSIVDSRLAAAIKGLAPIHPVYLHLRQALSKHLRLRAAGGWPGIPATGPNRLEIGGRDPQVTQLRARLRVTDGPLPDTDDPGLFDGEVQEALKRFQRRHGLNDDGVLGRRTRRALGVPIGDRIAQLRAAMERWRWMPRELGATHVLVNVPAQRLWVYKGHDAILTMRTIVGKYKRQTPTFSAAISYFVLRPKWYVPNRIAVEDLVPKAQKDPDYYRRAGFTITDKASGEQVDPGSVDWAAYGKDRAFPFRLVQRAGDDNALGKIKIMFSNPYGVYLHDTSSPSLFLKEERMFSSGCIRVEQPLELASSVLSVAEPVAPEVINRMIAEAPINRHLSLKKTVPLHVVYMTAWADEHAAYFYEDSYARDARLLSAISN